MILRPALRTANRVNVHGQILYPERAEQLVCQQNQLCVCRGILCAEALQAKLVVLPQAAALRRLIAENRGIQIVHLARQRICVQVALQERACRTSRAFRLQGNGAIPLILEGVHFLLHNIRRVANAPQEKLCVLEYRGANLPVAGLCGSVPHLILNILPAIAVCRQHVPCASRCLSQHDCILLCHGCRKAPCSMFCMGRIIFAVPPVLCGSIFRAASLPG